MTKQYEIRTADLSRIEMTFEPYETREDALRFWMPRASGETGRVLVLHEWETDAEADRARLVFIEKNGIYGGLILINGQWLNRLGEPVSFLQFIDAARNAPKPTVKVIATPEGEAQ